jgi:membrane fusion protein, multidrug efflux system
MAKKIILVVVVLLAIGGSLAGIKALQIRAMIDAGEQMVLPPEIVAAAEVQPDSWQPVLRAVGSVAAVQGVMISNELPGIVRVLSIESGATVEEGAVLVQLDASTERAELQSAEASLSLARANLQRSRDLRGNNTISQAELEAAEAGAMQAEAEVERLRSLVDKRTIRAPFTGQLGIRQINQGQFLAAGAPIVSLQALDPVYVDFTLPQQRLAELATGLTVRVTADSFPGEIFEGIITAINPDLAIATRSVRLRATLENPDSRLRPGLFVSVEVLLDGRDDVLVIPATAVIFAPYGNSVFVVEPDDAAGGLKARQQFVRLGRTRGDFVTVAEGLTVGQSVVSIGAFKLRNGVAVEIDNSLAPAPSLNPRPADS